MRYELMLSTDREPAGPTVMEPRFRLFHWEFWHSCSVALALPRLKEPWLLITDPPGPLQSIWNVKAELVIVMVARLVSLSGCPESGAVVPTLSEKTTVPRLVRLRLARVHG